MAVRVGCGSCGRAGPACRRLLAGAGALLMAVTHHAFPAGTNWPSKVDPLVQQTTRQGEAEFLVFLAERADVHGAAAFRLKRGKGAHVFQCLVATAQRSQAPLRALLQVRGRPHRAFWIANAIWVRGDATLVETLAQRDDVFRVLPNPSVHFQGPSINSVATNDLPAAPTAGVEWNITNVRAPEVWPLGFTGEGVVIGAQDSGYQWDHPALIAHYRGWDGTHADHNYNWHDAIHARDPHLTNDSPCGYDLRSPCDDDAHGTHTMGTMVGDDGGTNRLGMAPGAKWIGCRNMDRGWGTPATYMECFQWFLAPTDLNDQNPDPNKAPDVINDSWYCPPEEGCVDPLILQTVVENVRAAGIVVVASAGNSGSACSSVNEPPAIYGAAFSVGATDSSNTIAKFSSRGPVTLDGSGRLKPDVSAPGVGIRSSVPPSQYAGGWSGTSMAGPHVAGLVALLLSAHPEFRGDVDAIEQLIRQTALPRTSTNQTCGGVLGTAVPNNTYGWGRVDALAALGLQDSDGDGMPDWQEALAGTDLRDPTSFLHVTEVLFTNTTALIRFTSVSNKLYDLEAKDSLGDAAWSVLATNLSGNNNLVETSDPNATAAQRFYRVRLVQ